MLLKYLEKQIQKFYLYFSLLPPLIPKHKINTVKIPYYPLSILKSNICMQEYIKHGYNPYHLNFDPKIDAPVEQTYDTIKFKLNNIQKIIYGITMHAKDRMSQRNVSNEMLKTTLKKGKMRQEGPQRSWDCGGRKVYTYNNLTVVTNFEQNRIVTVFWDVWNWSTLDKISKQKEQEKLKRKWLIY